MRAIHIEVMKRGSNKANSFVQGYDSEALDAALFLIPLMEFLPPEHPKVAGMLEAIEQKLIVNGRSIASSRARYSADISCPLASTRALFYLRRPGTRAHWLSMDALTRQKEFLKKCKSISGEVGLFAEEADPCDQVFLGNTPLLFAQVEYARAVREVAERRKNPRDRKER